MIDLLSAAAHSVDVLASIPGDGGPKKPPGVGDKFDSVIQWAKWIALGVCVLAVVIFGGGMAINYRRGDNGELIGGLLKIVLGVIIISLAVTLVTWFI